VLPFDMTTWVAPLVGSIRTQRTFEGRFPRVYTEVSRQLRTGHENPFTGRTLELTRSLYEDTHTQRIQDCRKREKKKCNNTHNGMIEKSK
jgi:hypothetical protein